MINRKKMGIIILICILIFNFYNVRAIADEVKIIKQNEDLVVEPSSKSFDLSRLKPGDTEESTMTIINKGEDTFNVSIGLKRVGEKQKIDLFEQLDLTLNYDGKEIFTGKMIELDGETTELGIIGKGTEKEIKAVLHLPGPETGNEYQNKEIEFNWVFTAKSNDTGVLPQTGEDIPILLYSIGGITLATGIFLFFKKKKAN